MTDRKDQPTAVVTPSAEAAYQDVVPGSSHADDAGGKTMAAEYISALHAAAAGQRGRLVLASYGENPDTGKAQKAVVRHFDVGDVEGMARAAERLGEREHANVYTCWALMREDLAPGAKGGDKDVVAVLAAVADFDDAKAAQWRDRLPLEPDWVVETSPGRFQAGFVFGTPQPAGSSARVAAALQAFARCDHGTKTISHVWRIPGLLNRPNAKKVREGRTRAPVMARLVKPWTGSRTKVEDLARALGVTGTVAAAPVAKSTSAAAVEPAHALLHGLPADLVEAIVEPAAAGVDRSELAFRVIGDLVARQFNVDQIVALFEAHPAGIGERYAGDHRKLRADVGRSYTKLLPDWVAEMNGRMFLVNENGKSVIYRPAHDAVLERHVIERSAVEDVRKLYANKRVHVTDANGETKARNQFDAWFCHPARREYLDGAVFMPGKDAPPGTYNLWRGWAVEPKAGDWSRMRAHIRSVICADDDRLDKYLMGWLARLVQDPGSPGWAAVVLRGAKGSGKGTLGNALLRMFGQHGLYLTHARHLVGNFNAHLRDACFLFSDEATFAGDKQQESALKGLITDPFMTVEGKHQNAVTVKNCSHILMATNEAWAVPASMRDERRFAVFDVDVVKDRAYFDELYREQENGGIAAMLRDLLTYDLCGYDVRDIPETRGLVDQKRLSLSGVMGWFDRCLYRGTIRREGKAHDAQVTWPWARDGLEIPKAQLYDCYLSAHAMLRDYRPTSDVHFWRALHDAMGAAMSEHRLSGDGRPRVVRFAPLGVCRQRFEKYMQTSLEWGEPDFEDDGPTLAELMGE
jgi:hypothetical protein